MIPPKAPPPKASAELVALRDVASLLAATLGWEKGEEIVRECAASIGVDAAHLTRAQASEIFDLLSGKEGIVGVTARFARSRIGGIPAVAAPASARSAAPQPTAPAPAPAPAPASRPRPAPATVGASPGNPAPAPKPPLRRASGSMLAIPTKRLSVVELSLLLAPSLGQEKALECLSAVVYEAGIHTGLLTREQALLVFDALAATPGIVGVTARFAKARIALRFEA